MSTVPVMEFAVYRLTSHALNWVFDFPFQIYSSPGIPISIDRSPMISILWVKLVAGILGPVYSLRLYIQVISESHWLYLQNMCGAQPLSIPHSPPWSKLPSLLPWIADCLLLGFPASTLSSLQSSQHSSHRAVKMWLTSGKETQLKTIQ